MAAFDAGTALDPMDWDFSKYDAGTGTVPEPSDVEIERFLKKYRVMATSVMQNAAAQLDQQMRDDIKKRAKVVEDQENAQVLSLDDALEVMKQVDITAADVSPAIVNAMADLVVTITKGSPSKEQLLKLPNRVRGAFYGWLIGQLTDPEFSAAATRPALSLVNGG